MALTEVQLGQQNFLLRGGLFERPMQQMRKAGTLPSEYVFQEYPKMIRISQGIQDFDRSTEDCKGRTLHWTERKEVFQEIIVNSLDEEERVLSGGKTSAEIEDERQDLLQRCRNMHIHADPTWTIVRLKRELGMALDAPAEEDRMAKLQRELDYERRIAEMEAELSELRAKRGAAPEADELREQLTTLGVKVDGRWSVQRLREELDRATDAG